jgi:hypothetical protein
MSDTTTSLTQLASFIGQSALSASDAAPSGQTARMMAGNLAFKPQRRSVSDLLGVVLTLSARTRRMVLPQVDIDIDVFHPDGARAVRLILPHD